MNRLACQAKIVKAISSDEAHLLASLACSIVCFNLVVQEHMYHQQMDRLGDSRTTTTMQHDLFYTVMTEQTSFNWAEDL